MNDLLLYPAEVDSRLDITSAKRLIDGPMVSVIPYPEIGLSTVRVEVDPGDIAQLKRARYVNAGLFQAVTGLNLPELMQLPIERLSENPPLWKGTAVRDYLFERDINLTSDQLKSYLSRVAELNQRRLKLRDWRILGAINELVKICPELELATLHNIYSFTLIDDPLLFKQACEVFEAGGGI